MQNCSLPFKHNKLYYNSNHWLIVTIFSFLVFISPNHSLAQNLIDLEEISISLIVQEIGTVEIPALISEQKEVYLPVKDLFDYLAIKNDISSGIDTLTGFFIHPEQIFLIDNVTKTIQYQDNVVNLKHDDLIRTETNLYLKTNYFGDVFGLICTFNFRRLSVDLNTQIELPAIRDMRLRKMRQNIARLVGEAKADTVIGREFKLFHFGMLDWAIYNINYLENNRNSTRLNLSLGGIVVGGETRATLNYPFGQSLSEKNFTYFWRYVNNENHLLRQTRAGHIYSATTSQIYSPIVGIQLTNTPTSFRRSFGYHTLSDYTEPGWIVELYMNNVLVDYVKADDSGFYTFEVPLIYGNTDLKLRFYGPWGEELSSSQNISIPYTFLPAQEFEYTTTAGVVRDSKNSLFARTNLNYGISRYLTIGGGVEYLSSLQSQNIIPLLSTSLSITSSLLFFGEFAAGVKSNAILSYRMPSDLQFELDYTIYDKDQKAINTNRLEERKLAISLPISTGNLSLYSRFNVNQTIFPNSKYTFANLLFSGSVFGVSANLTTNARIFDYADPQLYSNLAISFSLPERFIIRPQTQYDYNRKEISLVKLAVEKQLFNKLNLHALIENNFTYDHLNFQFGLRYEFPFAQASSSVSVTNGQPTLYQSANGSFMYDGNTDYFAGNNRTSVGKSGIVILPYLDINANGHRDFNEPKVSGLDVRINGGRVESSERDTTIRIYDLEPYINYFIELNSTGFDYIAWQIKNSTISVNINANQFKLIEVPISVLGEVSGNVYLNKAEYNKGQGRMLVNFYNSDSMLVSSVLTEDDGFFSFLGFKPGSYIARIDPNQLNDLQMITHPNELSFEILPTLEGDYVDGLEFVLDNKQEEHFDQEPDFVAKNELADNIVDEIDIEKNKLPEQTLEVMESDYVDEREFVVENNQQEDIEDEHNIIVDEKENKKTLSQTEGSEVKEGGFVQDKRLILVLSGSANFNTGKADLQPNPKSGLDRLILTMKDNPETNWVIEGHTDNRGNENVNKKLSLDRAKSVLNYFIQNGLDVNRFEIVASGKSKPMADNSIEFGRALNRRVTIQEKESYEERKKSMKTFNSIEYDFLNEYKIGSQIFTDNKYYCIQVSSWKKREKAAMEVNKLRADGHSAFYYIYQPSPNSERWFRVRVGYFNNLQGAREYLNIIR